MGRRLSVLQCLQSLITTEQISCPLSAGDAGKFLSCLYDDLEKLERSLSEGPVNLQWSTQAMNLLKKMQVEVLNLLKNSKLANSYGSKQDWFDQYMEETNTLLDFCNSIKSAVSGISRYRILVDLTINDASKNLDLKKLEKEYERICESKVYTETLTLDFACEGRKKSSVFIVMLAVKSTTAVVSLLVFSTIVSSPAVEIMNNCLDFNPKLNPLWEILRSLVERYRDVGGGSPEHEEVGSLVGKLKEVMVVDGEDKKQRYMRSVELLRSKADELREKVEMFDSVVDQVFDVVIKARNEMLGAFRDEAL